MTQVWKQPAITMTQKYTFKMQDTTHFKTKDWPKIKDMKH